MSLLDLAIKHDANKLKPDVRHFCDFYEGILPPRSERVRLLEIGVQFGRSLRMWREWYGLSAYIGAVDCDDFPRDACDWGYVGRQEAPATIAAICGAGPWHVIIDDASHRQNDQLATLAGCWPALAPRGWYVIEDTHTWLWPEFGPLDAEIDPLQEAWLGMHAWAWQSARSAVSDVRCPSITPGCARIVAEPGILAIQKGCLP